MTPRWRRAAVTAVVATMSTLGVLAACGTPPEDSPRLVAADELQFDPADTATTTSSTTTPVTQAVGTLPDPATQMVTIYFVDEDDRLVPVQRELRAPPDLTSVLGALLNEPNQIEQSDGLRSTLPPGAVVRINLDRGVAEVALSPGLFDEILPRDQVLAFAQLVLTLTSQPGVGQVRFTSGGETLSVPRGDGSLVRPGMALSFEDYAELVEGYEPPPATTTSAPTSTTAVPRSTTTTTPGAAASSTTTA
ncbi:MAG TPA: GerMN domain-containing protein [Acidimicrobiales bacterium]|nr:GerMN domain-containing protein [Acidimicrobiales bacterium]